MRNWLASFSEVAARDLNHEMALTGRVRPYYGHPPAARNLCRAERANREIRSAGDAGHSCAGGRRTERKTSRSKYSSCRHETSAVRTSGSRWKDGFVGGAARAKTARGVFHPRALVPFLCGSDGSDESDRAGDRTSGSNADRDLSADGEAIVLHARPAQAAFSVAFRCGQPDCPAVRSKLSRAGIPGRGLPASLRESAVYQRG